VSGPAPERASGWLVRHRLRRRWRVLALVAALVAIGATGALTAMAAGLRTQGAYAHHLRDSEVGDVAVNPSLSDRQASEILRSTKGVRRATHDAMLLAGLDDGHPRTRAEFEADPSAVLVRGSTDGRRTAMDRPVISRGHEIRRADEVLVTAAVADRLRLDPGDHLSIAFWSSSDDVTAELEDTVEPIAVEDVVVAGVATLHDEVLPDDLYPRGQVIISPELAARYSCEADLPPVDTPLEEVIPILLPEGCSTSYDYWSLDVDGGAAGVPKVLERLTAAFDRLNEDRLPRSMVEQDFVHSVIATTTADEQERVERATRPTTTALLVLAAGTAALAIVILSLAIARAVRADEDDLAVWRQLGITGRQRAVVVAVPLAIAVAVGTAIALAATWGLSSLAPVGVVRAVDPHPARQLTGAVLAAGLALMGLVVAVGAGLAVVAARRSERRTATVEARAGLGLARAVGSPAVADGLRSALGPRRGARLAAASGAVAVAVLLGALVFGTSLRTVIDTPADYGWRWDAGILGGYGYGRQDISKIRASLDARPDVERWDGLAMAAFAVDGEPVVGLVGLADDGPLNLTMASGRMPEARGEVALGSRTAAAIGAHVGSSVELSGDIVDTPHRAKVTGIAVLPALGPYQSDRAAPGVGLVVAPDEVGTDVVEEAVTFVGLDLAPGTSAAAVLSDLRGDLADWAVEGDYTRVLPDPVRPPEIVDAQRTGAVPLLVGGLLAAAAALCLLWSVLASVRARRRELATLRALGFTGRQLRTSVRVQTIATMALALGVGVPIGLVVGRLAWRAFATRLGVVTEPAIPWAWIVGTAAGGVAVALLAAAAPARAAASLDVATAIRDE
jgi:hypothetical protein